MSYNKIENVLVIQGGGSLGAFACEVYTSSHLSKLIKNILNTKGIIEYAFKAEVIKH